MFLCPKRLREDKMNEKERKFFQIQKVEEDLKELKNGQKLQAEAQKLQAEAQVRQDRILSDISNTLRGIGNTMKDLSRVNEKQIRHDADIESLKEDSKTFKTFMENSRCSEHSTELKVLTKASDSKNNFAALFVSGFLVALVTGLLTWMITVKG